MGAIIGFVLSILYTYLKYTQLYNFCWKLRENGRVDDNQSQYVCIVKIENIRFDKNNVVKMNQLEINCKNGRIGRVNKSVLWKV